MFIDTLIIGNGFAGRTLGSALEGEFLIVERGEKFNIFERRAQFNNSKNPNRKDAMIREAYLSKHEFNAVEKMAPDCRSEYIVVDGGCSNHWGGLSFRLTEGAFSKNTKNHSWPFSYETFSPYYSRAESMMRLSADVADPEIKNASAEILGADKWRAAFSPFFPKAYVGAQAHNLTLEPANGQNVCVGTGDCELCPVDSKLRSLHIDARTQVLNGVMVDRLVFEDGKAVEAICITEEGPLSIKFNRVIVAAHGVESVKLLAKSDLPAGTPRELLGRHYQDHAVAELVIKFDGASFPFHELNTASQVIIPELSGEQNGIEYQTLGLLTPAHLYGLAGALDLDKINSWELEQSVRDMGATLNLFVLLEIPPEWDVSIDYKDGKVSVGSASYHEHKVLYNQIVQDIYDKARAVGGTPIIGGEIKHYMHWFGTHHLVGTLGMGTGDRAVVNPDFRLKGTDNVYVTGSSIFPRCGSRNPTLTVVALSLMLAEQLNAQSPVSLIKKA